MPGDIHVMGQWRASSAKNKCQVYKAYASASWWLCIDSTSCS